MRRFTLFCWASVALAAAAACATSKDETPLPLPNDPSPEPSSDGERDGGDFAADGAVPSRSSCSGAGWCLTQLPDRDLTMRDIWPLEGRAFALAESETLGVKVLEWDDGERIWRYIDDNSQNAYGSAKYTGKIWSPNENEVYYGVHPAYIYHGKRETTSSPWVWERSQLDDNNRDTNPEHDHGHPQDPNLDAVALGVWGLSTDDVYAWYANTIFHRKVVDGGAAWIPEYVGEDSENPADTFFVFSASGSSKDDVWFGGARGRYDDSALFACPIAIHKTADGYRQLVDSVINKIDSMNTCEEKAGALSFYTSFFYPQLEMNFVFAERGSGAFTYVESAGHGAIAGIAKGQYLAYVTSEDVGSAHLNELTAINRDGFRVKANSVWIHGPDAWLSGWGIILRTKNDPAMWNTGASLTDSDSRSIYALEAGTIDISTLALNGAPLSVPLYVVRGTSDTNLWAIGPGHALHKTTP